MKFRIWDIWLARFRFEDSEEHKVRPVLILEDGTALVFAAKMTKTQPRTKLDYVLVEWREAGLNYETTVSLERKQRLTDSDFIHKIGRMTAIDIAAVLEILVQSED